MALDKNGKMIDDFKIVKNNNNQIFNILNKNSIPREYSCNIMDKPLNNQVETDNNNVIGWSMTGATVGFDWCKVNIPSKDWIIKKESTHRNKVKILSYNLFWWNLYGKRQGNQASASKLISNSNNKQEFDSIKDNLNVDDKLFEKVYDFATSEPNSFLHVSFSGNKPIFFKKFDRIILE